MDKDSLVELEEVVEEEVSHIIITTVEIITEAIREVDLNTTTKEEEEEVEVLFNIKIREYTQKEMISLLK